VRVKAVGKLEESQGDNAKNNTADRGHKPLSEPVTESPAAPPRHAPGIEMPNPCMDCPEGALNCAQAALTACSQAMSLMRTHGENLAKNNCKFFDRQGKSA
jgi:hypothetical protein